MSPSNVSIRDDESRWAKLRAEFPVLARCAYLNAGTAGPTSRAAHEAMAAEDRFELTEGRGNFVTFGRYLERGARVRTLVGQILGAKAGEIALTHHTSDGCNIVLWGKDWRRGDVIVTTTLEHDAVTVPLGLLRERFGVELRFVDIGLGGSEALPALRAALAGARLCVVSHIVYSTGALLPLAEVARAAHEMGVEILVDGAQSVGAMPIDVHADAIDYYTVSGQKWLCGPEGTGALYVRRDRQAKLAPTFASYFTAAHHDFLGHVTLQDDARRYEMGMLHRPSLAAFEASLEMIRGVDMTAAWARARSLAAAARAELEEIRSVRLLSPATAASHLVSFTLEGHGPESLRNVALDLSARGVVIRSINHTPYALRAAFGFFNDQNDVKALVRAVAETAAR